jgi:hypothetical protein
MYYLQNSHTDMPFSAPAPSLSKKKKKGRHRLEPTKNKTNLNKHYWTSAPFNPSIYPEFHYSVVTFFSAISYSGIKY